MSNLKFIFLLAVFVLFGNLTYAQKGEVYLEEKDDPKNIKAEKILFGGTLLSYTAQNVPPHHLAFEQFFFLSNTYGHYDKNSNLKHDISFQQYQVLPYLKFGIIENLDINIITSVVYSLHNKNKSVSLGDTLVLFGLQLMKAKEDSWVPDVRLLVGESFPTGKYDRLNPSMNGGDGVGSGSFETTFLLSLAKVFPINKKHALRFNPNLYFIIPSHLSVSNFSIYGGGKGTRGRINPGNKVAFDFPCEYNITDHLIFGLDVFYIHKNKAVFSPKTANQIVAGRPSSENLSLAPCLEYNPNGKFGIEGGVWFSVNGRNSFAFTTGTIVAWWYF